MSITEFSKKRLRKPPRAGSNLTVPSKTDVEFAKVECRLSGRALTDWYVKNVNELNFYKQ